MSDHEDRGPLLLKVGLRQAVRRLQQEVEAFAQLEAMAKNLGWQRVGESACEARKSLSQATADANRALDAAGELQVKAKQGHVHEHEHGDRHSHDDHRQ